MVKKDTTPQTKGINNALHKVDFTDTFSTTNHKNNLEEIARLIFETTPTWVSYLFRIRNFIVSFIGLKTGIPKDYNTNFKLGGYIGFFSIYTILENEIILGANDKHLNFRVSIFNSEESKYNIKVATLVEYKNLFGKVYMTIITPFHRIIVKRMVQQAYA
ncbi:DUF2867 domain-containing protein [Aquimarina longa]|uniref:DUF2867 domain-containing protein n=1 Tax=Aquimarina longa TaxID=1080221 RepID=UPI00078664B0|nr:DUF2867 domain-containing protein [Aquimarina longa]